MLLLLLPPAPLLLLLLLLLLQVPSLHQLQLQLLEVRDLARALLHLMQPDKVPLYFPPPPLLLLSSSSSSSSPS